MLVEAFDDMEVVGSATDGREGVRTVIDLRPDVVLMDPSMPVMDGVEATHTILRSAPETAVVILTTFAEPEQVCSLDAGAVGYLMKMLTRRPWRTAFGRQLPGDRRSTPGSRAHSARGAGPAAFRRLPDLTVKQREVLLLVAEGLPNRLVAKRLGVSEKTVKAHLTQIYASLG